MKKRMLNFPVYLVLFSLSVLLLLANSALAEGDGGWGANDDSGYIFQVEEDLHNTQKRLVMTVYKPDNTYEHYWGPASESEANTYQLKSMNGNSDMIATWQFNSVTQATVTVELCTTNCLWQSGQEVTLNKFFGDMKADAKIASRVPKTGQTGCWDTQGIQIDCRGTGQDGEYQYGVLPAVYPCSFFDEYDCNAYTVHGFASGRFTRDPIQGTVTDNLTGLIWMHNANCTHTVGGVSKSSGELDWESALTWCNSLSNGHCGLYDASKPGDWRLPNINELHSLIDPYEKDPALPPRHYMRLINVQPNNY